MKKIKIYMIITLSLLLGFFIINFVSGYFGERVEIYIEQKAALFASQTIENALREAVIDNLDTDDLYTINDNIDGTVKSVIVNTASINEILANVNTSVSNSIEDIKNEKLSLPLGIIISDTLFGDKGPDINIKIIPAPQAVTDIIAKATPYGINSSILEISIKVKIDYQAIIPLRRNDYSVSFNIPLVITILNSEVPHIYLMNNN